MPTWSGTDDSDNVNSFNNRIAGPFIVGLEGVIFSAQAQW